MHSLVPRLSEYETVQIRVEGQRSNKLLRVSTMESREVPDGLLAGQRVLVVWHRAHIAEVIQPVLKGLRERAGGGGGQVVIEHAERLTLGEGG